jgi:SPP1 family predicted phage head-tail adaptor
VVIQQDTTTADTQGGRASSWGTLATVWGAVVPLTGGEQIQARAAGSQVAYVVEIQARVDVTPSMRLSWTGYRETAAKTLQILAVRRKDGEAFRLLLDCGEVA